MELRLEGADGVYEVAGVRVERIVEEEGAVVIDARATAPSAGCPGCGQVSERVRSRYVRTLRDLSSCGRPVVVRLTVRRFVCRALGCPRRTFAEQVDGATAPHRRAAVRLEVVLSAICAALGGEAGSRLAGCIGMAVGGDALLRLLRRGDDASSTPRVLGVDDWAWRRGRRYGSVLVDLEAGRPIDLLPDRSAASLAAWLKKRPGVEVIVRDRSTEYARGAAMGAPDALQVVDRWHVLRNVREAAERLLERHRQDLRLVHASAQPTGARRRSPAEEARRVTVRRRAAEFHAEVQRLAADGGTISGIARHLGVTRTMVRRYLFADGLRRERSELLAALSLPWSTGPVEGHITRLKLIKRQGYGRAGLDTLKRRFLRAA